jgi:hypothetical protein
MTDLVRMDAPSQRADVAAERQQFGFVPQAGIGPSIRSKSSPAPEIFFCINAFHRKATPFLGQKPFLDTFLGDGA